MNVHVDISNLACFEPSVVTIGKFDGAHLGHLVIFKKMISIAKKRNLKTVAITFSNPPIVEEREPKNGGVTFSRIFTNDEKRDRLKQIGLDHLVELPFTEELKKMSGEDFLRNILIGKLRMKVMVCGEDCAFGYQKSGNLSLLERLKEELCFEYVVVKKIKDEKHREISSSLVRDLLSHGKIEEVNTLMQDFYSIKGVVEVGNQLGHTIDFPTANIFPNKSKRLPVNGVYATMTKVHGEWHNSLTNIGTNPSIKNDAKKHVLRIETYLFDFDRIIYGEEIEVRFLKYIRGEMHFDGLASLKRQLEADQKRVRQFHASHTNFMENNSKN